jgi:predicted PurR-regulated permease PerM
MMSELEFYEAAGVAAGLLSDATMNAITAIFAYLIASHFVGEKLPRGMAVCLSVVYTLWLIGPLSGVYGNIVSWSQISAEYLKHYPEGILLPGEANVVLSAIVAISPLILGWLSSLYYLHFHVRNTLEPAGT